MKETRRRIGLALSGLSWGHLLPSRIDGEQAARWLAAERRSRSWSAASYNLHARALRAFGKWLVRKTGAGNPFSAVPMLNVAAEGKTFDRRALSDSEFKKLLKVASRGPRLFGLSGPDRSMAYRIAAYTGLRIGELAVLTPESFNRFEGRVVSVTVPGTTDKRRKEGTVPLPKSQEAAVRRWLAGRPSGEPVFVAWSWWSKEGAEMLQVDLAAAGIPYDTPDGRFDFHALRVQYVTSLARAGVSLTEAQKLARHSDPKLTANIYTKLHHELRDAADKLK